MRQIKMVPIEEVKPYPNNPRRNDDAVDGVATSLKEYGWQQPIVVDKDNVVIAGHTRLRAAQKLKMKQVPILVADNLSHEQVMAYRLADNKSAEASEWDEDLLIDELQALKDLDYDITLAGFDEADLKMADYDNEGDKGGLARDFIVPPMSVLDTRQGDWQKRKKAWKELGLDSGKGRDEALLGNGGLDYLGKVGGTSLTGTSIFDPVLCEICYKWFCTENGSILDPFAGGSVRGIVAEYLGYHYTGVDLSEKQIEADKKNAAEMGLTPTWYCDDSRNIDKYAKDESVDMVFSCPPYFDLEKYSDNPNDLSNMSYEDFLTNYGIIINKALRALKNDRFAVFVVGDVRDKEGFYRDFISDTKKIFIEGGAGLYNELILVESISTAAMRARRQFEGGRKVCKVNQNVLVFYKGNPKKIKENYPKVEVADLEADKDDMGDVGPFDDIL